VLRESQACAGTRDREGSGKRTLNEEPEGCSGMGRDQEGPGIGKGRGKRSLDEEPEGCSGEAQGPGKGRERG